MGTLWDNATFNAPFSNGIIATSDEVNASLLSNDNSVIFAIQYHDFTPDGDPNVGNHLISGVVQRQVNGGVWIPIASHEELKDVNQALQQHLDLTPTFNANPGEIERIQDEGLLKIAVTRYQINLRSQGPLRLVLKVRPQNPTNPHGLTQVVVSAWFDTYQT